MIAAVIVQPIILNNDEGGLISQRDSSDGNELSSSIIFRMPVIWPAPTTASTRLPGAFRIRLARYWSRSSIKTVFTSGKVLPNSCIIVERESCDFILRSSSSETSVLSKRLAKSEAISENLRYHGVQLQVRRSVTLMSRSARRVGMFASRAFRMAP